MIMAMPHIFITQSLKHHFNGVLQEIIIQVVVQSQQETHVDIPHWKSAFIGFLPPQLAAHLFYHIQVLPRLGTHQDVLYAVLGSCPVSFLYNFGHDF